MILALLTHLALPFSSSFVDIRWAPAAVGALCLAQALLMWRTGPRGRGTVPAALVAEVERAEVERAVVEGAVVEGGRG